MIERIMVGDRTDWSLVAAGDKTAVMVGDRTAQILNLRSVK